MIKLKLKLVESSEILSREELRKVLGGEYGSGNTGSGETCGLNFWKDGKRIKTVRNISKDEAVEQQIAWQHDADGRALYDYVYWCCDNCE